MEKKKQLTEVFGLLHSLLSWCRVCFFFLDGTTARIYVIKSRITVQLLTLILGHKQLLLLRLGLFLRGRGQELSTSNHSVSFIRVSNDGQGESEGGRGRKRGGGTERQKGGGKEATGRTEGAWHKWTTQCFFNLAYCSSQADILNTRSFLFCFFVSLFWLPCPHSQLLASDLSCAHGVKH